MKYILWTTALILFTLWFLPPTIKKNAPIVAASPDEANRLIDVINSRNESIHSLYCPKVDISIIGNPLVRLRGELAYEKPNNFRMIINSRFREESDIGSNNQMFWFWSGRMEPSVLYYADHKDMHKTRLKTPFHPKWMIQSLGLDKIEHCQYAMQQENFWFFYYQTTSVSGKMVTRVIKAEADTQTLVGHFIFENGICVASSETEGNQITLHWHEENVGMIWRFNQVQTNIELNSSFWDMPNIQPREDMGN